MAALGLLLLARLEVGSAKVGVKDADVAAKRASAAAGVEVGAPRVRRVDDEGLKVVQRGHEAAELARGPHEQRLEPRPVLHVLGCLVVVGAVGAADKGARRDRGIDVAVYDARPTLRAPSPSDCRVVLIAVTICLSGIPSSVTRMSRVCRMFGLNEPSLETNCCRRYGLNCTRSFRSANCAQPHYPVTVVLVPLPGARAVCRLCRRAADPVRQ